MDARSLISQWRSVASEIKRNKDGKIVPAWSTNPFTDLSVEQVLQKCADQLEEAINNAPVRVLRVLEYTGNRAVIEQTLARGTVKGTYDSGSMAIRSAIIGEFPEILIDAPAQEKEN